ncbi:MAG: HPr family phosphocarrier protein [Tissierellales bacterium]|jgi:phosphotransferase system HPr (HPr) family protein|nr:HPr family phosphocarrier protein [Tissierellales bacterium]
MVKREVTIKNETGLHARPASLFVQTAVKHASTIKIEKDGKEFDAKSMLGVLSLGANKGTVITIKADGDDEQAAVDALANLIETFED